MSNRAGVSPRFGEVKAGDTLPRRVIGPHSIASFTTEYRAFLFSIWGTFGWVAPAGVEEPWINQDPGWVEGFTFDEEGGYLDAAGRLFWEGRLTDIIKTGGANVSPREVDEVLAQHPGVEAAQTVGVPHETLGEIVVACVVAHEGVSLEAEEIRSFLRERLASYKVPRRVLFFRPDEITLTGSAKIKSADLRDLAAKALATSP